ncbi:MAG: hypothetical protein E2581_08855 [Pseudomonas sp.]|uniref:hypothetical protein n=1 Tax=Pseudomonas sp. TaxID=306 RepID=UPI001E13451D|nr:hypothetical protein [Pseudomonas sp.]MPS98595.1 hypothetical protein [Pseudomonas sp.]
MTNKFDSAEIGAITERLRSYEARCDELLDLLGESPDQSAVEKAKPLYASLKSDLKTDAKKAASSQEFPESATAAFFFPAVNGAALQLKPATNSHPVISNWFAAVYGARIDIADYLSQITAL